MRTLASLLAATAIAAFGFTGTAFADPFADAAVLVLPAGDDCPTAGGDCDTSNDDDDGGADALAAPDHTQHAGADGTNSAFTSLGFNTDTGLGGVLTLDFLDNACLNLAGDDLQVFEVTHNETYDIDVGIINGTLSNVAAAATGDALVDAGVAFNRVEITALDTSEGGFSGADIDAIQCLSPLDVADIVKDTVLHGDDVADTIHTGDKDTVFFGLDTQQFKAFTITITNNTGVNGGLSGLTFIDATGAEWDLDPLEEDDVNSCSGNAEVCDGVDVTSEPSAGDCTATGVEHTTQGKSGKEKLQPDIITVTAGGLDDGESCTITAWVMTDLKKGGTRPGRGNSPVFAPTDCPVPLNDGVKVFDASMNLLLQDDDELIFSDEVGNTCEIP